MKCTKKRYSSNYCIKRD